VEREGENHEPLGPLDSAELYSRSRGEDEELEQIAERIVGLSSNWVYSGHAAEWNRCLGRAGGRDSSKNPGCGSAFSVLAVQRRSSSERSPHALAGDTGCAVPCPHPALRRHLMPHSPSVFFSYRDSVQVGWAGRPQASQAHVGWWWCLPKSRERSRQAAILWQQRPGNPDFLRCVNGGFAQPCPACPRKVRAACRLCHGRRAPARNAATLPPPRESAARRMGTHSK